MGGEKGALGKYANDRNVYGKIKGSEIQQMPGLWIFRDGLLHWQALLTSQSRSLIGTPWKGHGGDSAEDLK